MSRAKPILNLDNTFTFGGAIIILAHLLKATNKQQYAPVLVTGQSLEYLKSHFSCCDYYHYVPKLMWVDNQRYFRIAGLPIFKNRLLLKPLNLSRFLFWVEQNFSSLRYARQVEEIYQHLLVRG